MPIAGHLFVRTSTAMLRESLMMRIPGSQKERCHISAPLLGPARIIRTGYFDRTYSHAARLWPGLKAARTRAEAPCALPSRPALVRWHSMDPRHCSFLRISRQLKARSLRTGVPVPDRKHLRRQHQAAASRRNERPIRKPMTPAMMSDWPGFFLTTARIPLVIVSTSCSRTYPAVALSLSAAE